MNLSTNAIPPGLISALRKAKHVVVFTGAGVSAESGIPTFRDPFTGLWERFDVKDLTTPAAFRADKELVWGWHEWLRMKVRRAAPNRAHLAIAALARQVPQLTVITQNVDDLHERAGSAEVVHLHGSLNAPRCFACNRPHDSVPTLADEPEGGRRLRPPQCSHCGGFVRPGVVWFQERLPEKQFQQAISAAKDCDVLLSIGTSGLVQPAAQIPLYAKHAWASIVQINPKVTELEGECDWSLRGLAGEIMPRLLQEAFPEITLAQ